MSHFSYLYSRAESREKEVIASHDLMFGKRPVRKLWVFKRALYWDIQMTTTNSTLPDLVRSYTYLNHSNSLY